MRIIVAVVIVLFAYGIWFSLGVFGIIGGLQILDVPGAQLIGFAITIAGFFLTLRFAGRLFHRVANRPNTEVK